MPSQVLVAEQLAHLPQRDPGADRGDRKDMPEVVEGVDAWHGSQRIRAAEHGTEIEDGSEAAEWIDWATAQVDRADPLVQPRPPSILDERKRWEAWP